MCTHPAVPRSTQPSTLRGMVNEYQLSGSVIIKMAMVVDSLQADSQPKSGGLVWGLAAAWRCSTFIKWTEWTLALASCGHDDRTINIVLVLLLLLCYRINCPSWHRGVIFKLWQVTTRKLRGVYDWFWPSGGSELAGSSVQWPVVVGLRWSNRAARSRLTDCTRDEWTDLCRIHGLVGRR